jgi:hypothetical protein
MLAVEEEVPKAVLLALVEPVAEAMAAVLAEVLITAEAVLLIQVVEPVAEITFPQFQMVDQVLLSFVMPSNERSI